jgi:zinc protease
MAFRKPYPLLFATTFLLSPGSQAASLPAGITQGPTVEGITEYRLENGLRVLLFPDPTQAKTTVNITYQVGSRMENYGETGMAHLLEHMLFKGTPSRGDLMNELARRGMDFNGTTWLDRTNYFETFTKSDDSLAWVLAMEADRMVHSNVARKDLDSEMTVVRNEMERGENDPERILIQRTMAVAFDWHNYGKDTIGARSDVELVDIAQLQAFYRTYYQPDNAVLTIAGAFDPDKALALIAKDFGSIPRPKRVLPHLYTVEPVQDGERELTLRRVGDTQWLSALYHTVPAASPDSVAIEAAVGVMTVTPGGRLYKALVETKKASAVDDFTFNGFDPSFVMFLVQVPGQDPIGAARETMLKTLQGVAAQPITDAELERVRAKRLKEIDQVISDPQRLGVALSEAIAEGDWRLFFIRRDWWRTVTTADVNRAAIAYFKPANLTVGQFIPDLKPDRSPTPPSVDVAALVKDYKGDPALAAGEVFDATPTNLDARTQRFALANGTRVALLPKKTRGETVQFNLRVNFGNAQSIFGKAGESKLTAEMLPRGTAKHTRQEIEDTLDLLRATLDVDGSGTEALAHGRTVRKHLPATLDLIAEILRQPSFSAEELDTLKREKVAELEQGRSEPRSIAVREFGRYGNPYKRGDDRYVPTLDEEIAELKAPDAAALKAFHAAFYGGSATEIAIVGDFDAAAIRTQLERLFGDWTSPQSYTRVPDPLIARNPAQIPIETPDKANAYMRGGLSLALNDRDPDYPALLLANYMIGGSTTSRLWARIRQKEGLSYGVAAWLSVSNFEPNTTFYVSATFAPEVAARLRTALREELTRVTAEGFGAKEVADAKQALLLERRLERARDASVAQALVDQEYLGRTFAFSGGVDQAIEALTAEQVTAVARKYVKPDAFAFVFAGDFAKKK